MEMKVAVIGAGISGLSISKMLKEDGYDVTTFEGESKVGGLIKCKDENGSLFHQTGGHVFNTKYKEAGEWFWNQFDREKEFTKALRNSAIVLKERLVPYPIENYVYQMDECTQKNIINDLLAIHSQGASAPSNFEEFLRTRFGETLYNIYFQPYNYKIWRKELNSVPLAWLEGKLPMPTVEEILFNNFNHIKEEAFVHSSFYYPCQGGSQFIAERLAQGLDICLNSKIEKISKEGNKWNINNRLFDKVVFCGNIKQLPSIQGLQDIISGYHDDINALEAHGTTAVFCQIDKNDLSWIYLPDREHESHRIICTGNFSPNNNKGIKEGCITASIEFTDYISKEDIIDNLKRIPYAPQYIDHHYEPYTYPIQSNRTRDMICSLKQKLEQEEFYLLGRFAEWEYYNMDVAINAAINLRTKMTTVK